MKKLWLALGLIAFLSGLIVIVLVEGPHEPEYHGRKLTRWVDDLVTSEVARTNATLAIRHMGTNAVPFLVQMLHAQDSPLKRKCMVLLRQQHWVHFAFRFDFERRDEAFQALAILGPDAKAAIPDLAELLSEGGERDEAVYSLYRIGPDAAPALLNALTNSDGLTRAYAAIGLGYLGDPSSVSNLLAILRDPAWTARAGAARALGQFPDQANIIVPALVKCLDDPESAPQNNAVNALAHFGPEAMPAFPKLLKLASGTNYDVSETAATALIGINVGEAIAAFTNNLKSPDVNVRRTAAQALKHVKFGGQPAVPSLVKCLKDPDIQVRVDATYALGNIGADPELVVPALVENLNDPNHNLRVVTAIALSDFGERAKFAVPQIVKIVEQYKGDEDTFRFFCDTLADIDPDAAAKLSAK